MSITGSTLSVMRSSVGANTQSYRQNIVGLIYHWNMGTFTGEQWATPNLSNPSSYWNPTALNMDQWLTAAASMGARYAYLTVKHHDGFALWPTAAAVPGYSPYSVAQTTWYASNGSPDLVGMFVSKCRNHGLKPGIYFSVWDRTYEARSATTISTGYTNYVNFIKSQLIELLTSYGPLLGIWTDGWTWTAGGALGGEPPYFELYNVIKTYQPNCLLVNNSHQHPTRESEIEVFETSGGDGPIPSGNKRIAEEINTICADASWFWNAPIQNGTKTATSLQSAINNAVNNNATYLLNVPPDTTGNLVANHLATLSSLKAQI